VRCQRSINPLHSGRYGEVLQRLMPNRCVSEVTRFAYCRPWSVVILCGHPKRAIHVAWSVLATVSAVMSDIGATSGHLVVRHREAVAASLARW
jgi:hypothetical protein